MSSPTRPLPLSRLARSCCLATLALLVASVLGADLWHRMRSPLPPVVPADFVGYYLGGAVASTRGTLYLPPASGQPPQTFMDLGILAPPANNVLSAAVPLPRAELPFITPPGSAMVFAPLSRLPWRRAFDLWTVLGVIASLAAIYLCLTATLARNAALPRRWLAYAWVAALFWYPLRSDLVLGNIDWFTLLCWSAAAWLMTRRRIGASAAAMAVGTWVKFTPVLVVPLLVWRRQWRWLGYYGVSLLLLLGGSVYWLGWNNHRLWVAMVAPTLSRGVVGFYNRSLPGFIAALLQPHLLRPSGLAAAGAWGARCMRLLPPAILAAGYYWLGRRHRGTTVADEIMLLPLLPLVAGPISWTSHYVLALLPLAWVWLRVLHSGTAAPHWQVTLLCTVTLALGLSPLNQVMFLGAAAMLGVMALWLAASATLVLLAEGQGKQQTARDSLGNSAAV